MIPVGPPNWSKYQDLGEDIAIPRLGVRLLMYIDSNGKMENHWCVDADEESATLLVGALEQVKFEIQCALMDRDDDDA